MVLPLKLYNSTVGVALAALLSMPAGTQLAWAQQNDLASELAAVPLREPAAYALPLPEDRGQADLVQTLKRLGTTASVLMIVAHPDDEDGALLTYLTRGLGARATLFTLTRGEGGQNAMSAESYDALGLIRTNELLRADQAYGADQLWGTEADFGFSKTQEESFTSWGHERVLYDAVLAVRKVRPQVIVASFLGGVTDGHGQHQVSGEIAQEAFKAAADPKIFPDQLKDGLEPWQAQAVYSRAPFAAITDKGMFDSATGKYAPAKFHNYITDEWITGRPSTDVSVPEGTWDPVLGRTYTQISREGWGEQKSQYGGASPQLSEPAKSDYHLWGATAAATSATGSAANTSLFDNSKVKIDTSLEGLAHLAGANPPAWLADGLDQIAGGLTSVSADVLAKGGAAGAHLLVPIYRQTLDLYAKVRASDLPPAAKAEILFELANKIDNFQQAFKDLLGLDFIAFRTNPNSRGGGGGGGPMGGGTADETAPAVTPGETFSVRAHVAQAVGQTELNRIWFVSTTGTDWKAEPAGAAATAVSEASIAASLDRTFKVQVADNAQPTAPYFTRPTTEQAIYDISNPAWRLRSFAPWPLEAWAEFTFDGVPIRLGQTVQTLQHLTGPGGFYEPLVVTPPVGVRISPEALMIPLDGSALPVKVTVEAQAAAEGTVALKLPEGWRAAPAEIAFHLKAGGNSEPLVFSVTPAKVGAGSYAIQAVAMVAGHSYETGWQRVGYQGLRPYNQYRLAKLQTRKIDVKVAPGLRVAYVMGTGDTVPEAIEALGITPHLLTPEEITSGDLSAWNVIVIGIRAYSNRPELTAAQQRLDQFVERGGTLVVQYQSATFAAPLPLSMGRSPERVVDEHDAVKLLDATDPLLSWPNKISNADFDGWFEERGHSFLDSWDQGYKALTETNDPGQEPQRGGLLVTHSGKGTYVYVAYALYRQFPELVPGAYRLLANLLSAGQDAGGAKAQSELRLGQATVFISR